MSSSTNSLFKKVDSSDYISFKRQEAISTEKTALLKKNGSMYNTNFTFVPINADPTSSCLVNAKSYDLKQDYKTGQNNTTILCANNK